MFEQLINKENGLHIFSIGQYTTKTTGNSMWSLWIVSDKGVQQQCTLNSNYNYIFQLCFKCGVLRGLKLGIHTYTHTHTHTHSQ